MRRRRVRNITAIAVEKYSQCPAFTLNEEICERVSPGLIFKLSIRLQRFNRFRGIVAIAHAN